MSIDRAECVRRILIKDWDPLVAGDDPNLSDEYDDLIPGILQLLDTHCTGGQLGRHLASIDAEWGGEPSWPEIDRTAEASRSRSRTLNVRLSLSCLHSIMS